MRIAYLESRGPLNNVFRRKGSCVIRIEVPQFAKWSK
jgi:hypothetical protein